MLLKQVVAEQECRLNAAGTCKFPGEAGTLDFKCWQPNLMTNKNKANGPGRESVAQ